MREIRYLKMGKNPEVPPCAREEQRSFCARAKKGFTLAEMLITVAIIGILAAFGFVAVIRYQKSLKQTELDNTAREIFVAAQNHMTVAKSSGSWDIYVSAAEGEGSDESVTKLGQAMGAVDDGEPSDYDGSLGTWSAGWTDGSLSQDEKHDFRYVVTSADGASDPGIMSMILPTGAIDETLRGDGNILIEYDAETANVYGVWFCKAGDLSEETGSAASVADTDAYNNNNRTDKSSRMNSSPMVGYYGGASVNKTNPEDDESYNVLQGVGIAIENDDRLVLNVSVPAKGFVDEKNNPLYEIKASVKGVTSGKVSEKVISSSVSASSTSEIAFDKKPTGADLINMADGAHLLYSCILDSVTDGEEYHFANRFPDLIPGEDIEITVTVSQKGQEKESISRTVTANSLFANSSSAGKSASGTDSGGKAVISYGRHLQNLSTQVSGVNEDKDKIVVQSASLQADIDWDQMKMSGVLNGDQITDGTAQRSGYTVSPWNTEGKSGTAATEKGYFVSLYNPYLTSFAGGGHKISNLKLDTCTVDGKNYAGLFGLVKCSDETNADASANALAMTISSLSLANPVAVEEKADYLGFIIGRTDSAASIDHVTISADGTSGTLQLQAKTGSGSPYNSGWWDNPAGGIVGISCGSDITVKNTAISAKDYKIGVVTGGSSKIIGGNTGGIMGAHIGAGSVSLQNCKIDIAENGTFELEAGYRSAGGLIGTVEPGDGQYTANPDKTTVNNCEIRGADSAKMQIAAPLGYDTAGFIAYSYGAPLTVSNSKIDGFANVAIGRKIDREEEADISFRASGGIVGEAVGADTVTITNTPIETKNLMVLSGEAAGGLAGRIGREPETRDRIVKKITINGSDIKADTVQVHHMQPYGDSRNGFHDNNQNSAPFCTVGGILGRAYSSETSITNTSVIAGQSLTIQSDRNSNIGGILGMQVGTGAKLSIIGCNVEITGKLRGGEKAADTSLHLETLYGAGGILGSIEPWNDQPAYSPGALTVTDCHVFDNAEGNDTITGESSAGGLIAFIRISGVLAVDKCSATAYILDTDQDPARWKYDYGSGGLIGSIRSAGNGSAITHSYAGGRTSDGGKYQTDTGNAAKGRYNVIGSQGSPVGGFIGQLGIYNDSVNLTISDCFTTASAYSSDKDRAGSFIGNRNQNSGSITIQNCYSTGITNGSVFAGVSAATGSSGNYYLSGINENQFADNNVISASIGASDTPFAAQTASPETYPYDTDLSGKKYPFRMTEGADSFYGDWPEVSEQEGNFGLIYYEIIKGDPTIYYEGFIASDAESYDKAQYTYVSSKGSDITKRDEVFVTGHDKYVQEDGYVLLVNPSDQAILDAYVGTAAVDQFNSGNHYIHPISNGQNQKVRDVFQLYDDFSQKLGLGSFNAYLYQWNDSYTYQSSLGGAILGFYTLNNNNQTPLACFEFQPFFSDEIQAPDANGIFEAAGKTITDPADPYYGYSIFSIRNARQLKMLAYLENNSKLNPSFLANNNKGKYIVQQELDISYDPDNVTFTTGGVTQSRDSDAYKSPKFNNIAGIYRGAIIDGSSVTLDGLTQPFVKECQGGLIENLNITNLKANAFAESVSVSDARSGIIQNLTVSNGVFTGNDAAFVKTNSGTIQNCTISNTTIGGDGAANSNSGTITGVTLENAKITGNGIASTNNWGGQITNCSITNTEISGNGLVGTNNGKIENCTISDTPTIGGDGAANSNSGTITGVTLKNAKITGNGAATTNDKTISNVTLEEVMIGGNGFIGTNGNQISGCNIINAQIGGNGFVENNKGNLSNCQLYADNAGYQQYLQNYEGQNIYFHPNTKTVDPTLAEDQQQLGYNLMVCGIAPDGSTDQANEKTAGFVQNNESGTIGLCSYSGKVYGKKQAAGFFGSISQGTIDSCYANALVSADASEPGSIASGFGISAGGWSTIQKSHSVGMVLGAVRGAGFIDTPTQVCLSSDYSAIWKTTTNEYHMFVSSVVQNAANISKCGYLSSFDFDQGRTAIAADTFAGVKSCTDEQLRKADNGIMDTFAADGLTSFYGQYKPAEETAYPYPMPEKMKAYGDWSCTRTLQERLQKAAKPWDTGNQAISCQHGDVFSYKESYYVALNTDYGQGTTPDGTGINGVSENALMISMQNGKLFFSHPALQASIIN